MRNLSRVTKHFNRPPSTARGLCKHIEHGWLLPTTESFPSVMTSRSGFQFIWQKPKCGLERVTATIPHRPHDRPRRQAQQCKGNAGLAHVERETRCSAALTTAGCSVAHQAEKLHRMHDVGARIPRLFKELVHAQLPPGLAHAARREQILRQSPQQSAPCWCNIFST